MIQSTQHITPLAFPFIEIEEAWALIRAYVSPLMPTTIPFQESLGHVLAEDVRAEEPLPPFRAAVVDGYALRAEDRDAWREVVGEQRVGRATEAEVGPGEAMWVATGAPVPPGADAVVEVERTEEQGTRIRPLYTPTPGLNIRPVGYDIAAGEQVLHKGQRIDPAALGILASVNALHVRVYPRPRVGVLSTGDEVVEPGHPLRPGQIRDSNRYTLLAAVQTAGGIPVDLGTRPDEVEALEDALEQGLRETDMVITCGGVSMGNRDYMKDILAQWGTIHFGRLRVKPGKPATFATVAGKPVFALPGNPVSALVAFYLYVLPALHILAGDTTWVHPQVRVKLAHPIHREPGRVEFQRARLRREGGVLWAEVTGKQASSRLLSMVSADALIRLEADWEEIPAGTEVPAILLNPERIFQLTGGLP
ncbi:MAG: molybdopterin molybdotransferase MoeA [Chloroflexi bacterium]|nr:molybdopterin molybdotransferase MoeA [Chloroflexota bacterium]